MIFENHKRTLYALCFRVKALILQVLLIYSIGWIDLEDNNINAIKKKLLLFI